LSVINAGHPPLIVVHQSGSAETVEMDSDPLGIFSAAVLQRKDLNLARGDRFFLYTDGLIEATPGGRRLEGIEKLTQACLTHRLDPLEAAAGVIARTIQSGQPAGGDDLLLLAAEVS
jgi:sigma-B regulation protein RsbU (phosphoserine phosphatase)